MRIGQIAPLFESVPPRFYGGTERVVSYLTDELVRQGHEVTLFASEDSRTLARHVGVGRAIRLDPACRDPIARHVVLLEKVFARAHEFDVLHFHIDYLHYPLSRRAGVACVTTLHGRLDLPDLVPLYAEFADMPVISISDAQRAPLPQLNWRGTVHHGLPRDAYALGRGGGGYLAFLGRLSPEKRPDRAVRLAERAGVRLLIAAKVDPADRAYYETIKPLLRNPWVEYVGEIGEAEKNDFLGNARALLFPIDWPEPFGLVMIEAMACGTPVIAYRCGAVAEIVDHGVTGFIVDGEAQALAAIRAVDGLDRAAIRARFERRFSVEHMALAYTAIYAQQMRLVHTKTDADERAA
ncbi:MAG TPA: glycosyltransferase family 4 protein [Gammaproteobacteria bacterium]